MRNPSDVAPAARGFTLRVDGGRRTPTLRLVGEVDLAAVPEIAAAGAKVSADPRATVIRVDLARVTFFDCSALRVLLDVDARASASGKAVCWRHVPGCVRRVLELTRTASSLAVVD